MSLNLLVMAFSILAFLGLACRFSIPNNHETNDTAIPTDEQSDDVQHELIPTMTATADLPSNLLEYRPVPDNGVVFYYDPDFWSLDESSSPYYHLYSTNGACEIYDPTYFGHGLSGPANPTPLYIGGRNWIETYGYLYGYRDGFVRFEIRSSGTHSSCEDLAFEVFSTMKIEGEVFVEEVPMPTNTPQPPFVCEGAPFQRGFIGAYAYTMTTVRLRSSPEYLDTNTIVKLPENTSFVIVGGPKCGEYPGGEYIYWEVEVPQSDGSVLQGWLAEGDMDNYYIDLEYGG